MRQLSDAEVLEVSGGNPVEAGIQIAAAAAAAEAQRIIRERDQMYGGPPMG